VLHVEEEKELDHLFKNIDKSYLKIIKEKESYLEIEMNPIN
jgi:hypothetical protein